MLRSTIGTWVNYATTLLFQVLFARSFGATPMASAYALTFAIAVGICAIFVGTAQAVYLPRLLGRDGAVLSATVKRVLRLTWIAAAAFALLWASASVIAPLLSPALNRADVHLSALMRLACVFGFTQVIVGQLAVLCWARGLRFVPAVSPALPSVLASIPMIAGAAVSTRDLYILLTVGSGVQVVMLAAVGFRHLRLSNEAPDRRGEPPTAVSLGTWAIAQLMVPFMVWTAARASSSGGADFNYAYRAIAVAEALLVGGITYSALPDWSDYFRTDARAQLEQSVAKTVSIAALALTVAAGVALVASQTLVRLVFQRGSFTPHDTRVVSAIVVAALPGFVAEGVMLVLSQAILAERRTPAAMAFGIGRAFGLIVCVAITGLIWGPIGVAVGYSITNVITLSVQLVYVWRKGIVTKRQAPLARATLLVTLATAAVALLLVPVNIPSLVRAALVCLVWLVFARAAGMMRWMGLHPVASQPPTLDSSRRRA